MTIVARGDTGCPDPRDRPPPALPHLLAGDYVSSDEPSEGTPDDDRHLHRAGTRAGPRRCRPSRRAVAGRARPRRRRPVPPRDVRRPHRQAVREARPGRVRRRAAVRGRRVRGLRGGGDRPAAERPGPDRGAGPDQLHAPAVGARGPGPGALRPPRRGRALALRTAGDPQAGPGAGRGRAGRAVRGRRDRVLPRPSGRERDPHPGRRQGHRGPALLRRPRPDPDVRPPHRHLDGDERPRLGQLRQRPRGRQRAVRAELRLRRRPDHGRPRHHRPLPDLGARRAARA